MALARQPQPEPRECKHCEALGLDPGSTVCVECFKDESDPLCDTCKDTGIVRRSNGVRSFEIEERCECGIQPESAALLKRCRAAVAGVRR